MKIRILYRQIQEVPVENREKQKEMEHESDLAALRLGISLPTRYRPFTGNMNSRIRIHEREFESIADFAKLHETWLNDPECKKIDEEWEKCYIWERREILYVDDANDPVMPWLQMAAESERTVKYTVNPNYKMPKEQENYKN